MAVKSGRPPYFKFALPAGVVSAAPARAGKSSPRARGYDARWDRLSLKYRRANPFCRFCEQEREDRLAEVVDHVIPVEDAPELRYEWSNLQALCKAHHDGLKQRMEKHARAHGEIERLRQWCDDPLSRPVAFVPAALLGEKIQRGD